jgi:probable phosphoglycerate mutase
MSPTRIVLARHGETDWNATGRWQGQADPALNDTGRRQAESLSGLLVGRGISAIYSSDLRRASETARLVAGRLGLEVVEDAHLREIDVGSWSGLTRADVELRFPDGFARWRSGEIGHDGETREQLTERVVAELHRIACAHPGETVLVVSHGGAIRAVRHHVVGDPGGFVENGAIVVLNHVNGELVLGYGWQAEPAPDTMQIERERD